MGRLGGISIRGRVRRMFLALEKPLVTSQWSDTYYTRFRGNDFTGKSSRFHPSLTLTLGLRFTNQGRRSRGHTHTHTHTLFLRTDYIYELNVQVVRVMRIAQCHKATILMQDEVPTLKVFGVADQLSRIRIQDLTFHAFITDLWRF